MPATQTLAHFDKARHELAKATRIDEVKDIRDKAEALRTYMRQSGESVEMQNHCAEIKIRAERRVGELLRGTEKDKGGGDRRSNHQSRRATGDIPTLSDAGITKTQSSRFQQLADVPRKKFDQAVEDAKGRGDEEEWGTGNWKEVGKDVQKAITL